MDKLLQKIIAIPIVLVLMCTIAISFCGCTRYPEDYTIEEHIAKISKRVQKRYMDNDDTLESFAIYPVYNEDDKLSYFLVGFEPCGFVFVQLGIQRNIVYGMYMRCDTYLNLTWYRYRQCIDGIEPEEYEGNEWIYIEGLSMSFSNSNTRFLSNEDGEIIQYDKSPYFVADVLDSKLYFMELSNGGGIPAVKNNESFVNLVSMESFSFLGENGYHVRSIPPRISIVFFYEDRL